MALSPIAYEIISPNKHKRKNNKSREAGYVTKLVRSSCLPVLLLVAAGFDCKEFVKLLWDLFSIVSIFRDIFRR